MAARDTGVPITNQSWLSQSPGGSFIFKGTQWPRKQRYGGLSASTGLPDKSIDFVVTDPPFFDNVHYSELADFFYAWQQLDDKNVVSTRNLHEVQDTDAHEFARKLGRVLRECHRALADDRLFVFTYHHSREDGWTALGADCRSRKSHPVRIRAMRQNQRNIVRDARIPSAARKVCRQPVQAAAPA
jgi:adenine-specific DNA methylase